MSDQPDKQVGKANEQEAAKIAIYEAMANRRLSLDSMMWQVPVLSLTAQAFLLTIALGTETSQFARSASAGLACVTAAISLQLMSKHRYHEMLDSKMLESLEQSFFGLGSEQVVAHSQPKKRSQALQVKSNFWVRLPSHKVWQIGMSLFALVGAAILVLAVAHPVVF